MSKNLFWCFVLLSVFAIGCDGGPKDSVPQGIDAKAIEEYERLQEPDLYKDYVAPR